MKIRIWAEYDKDQQRFTGEISHESRKPVVAKAYNWYTWKRCYMTLTEVKPKRKP